jgi:serine protease inhibitor
MLAVASYGESRTQILNALTNENRQELKDEDVKKFSSRLRLLDTCKGFQRTTKVYVISCHKAISVDNFLKLARTPFGVSCEQTPLVGVSCEGKTEEFDLRACQCLLNDWIGEKMMGKVTNAVETEFLSHQPSLVVVSMASFACRWMYAFERLANTMSFDTQGYDGIVHIMAMVSSTPLQYVFSEQFEAIEIPYEAEGISLVMLLPTIIDFLKTRQYITVAVLRDILQKLGSSDQKRKAVLPSFQVIMGEPVSCTLASLGIDNIFYKGNSERGGITGWKDMFVSNVTQTVLFQVDINEAADATTPYKTACGDGKKGLEKLFIVNRPFYYMVWNRREQIPLLFGQSVILITDELVLSYLTMFNMK